MGEWKSFTSTFLVMSVMRSDVRESQRKRSVFSKSKHDCALYGAHFCSHANLLEIRGSAMTYVNAKANCVKIIYAFFTKS